MTDLVTIKGDVCSPRITEKDLAIIPHCCNDIGAFGAGVAGAIARKWPNVQQAFYKWAKSKKDGNKPFELGQTQFVRAHDQIMVANMIGQHDVGHDQFGRAPIRYVALMKAMIRVHDFIKTGDELSSRTPSIHCPKFGSALAGGEWKAIESMVRELWVDRGIHVTVYEWP